jgi:hypothetical protein
MIIFFRTLNVRGFMPFSVWKSRYPIIHCQSDTDLDSVRVTCFFGPSVNYCE